MSAFSSQRQALGQRLRNWLQPQLSSGAREQRNQAVLLLAVAVTVAPHFEHLPWWSMIAIGAMWIWRAALTQTLRPGPGRWTMALLLTVAIAGLWLEHGTLFGRDAGVNFLLMLIGLKVLEMRAQRDVLVIVFLSFFVLETQFLFDETMASAALMLVSVALLFFVLLSVNLPEGDTSLRIKLRYLFRVFLLALPLTLAFFFLFPRLPSPIWHGEGGEAVAGTGLSQSMSPGSISRLLHNDAVALRARFGTRVPSSSALYWRGPVFGHFDGRTWSPLTPEGPADYRSPDVRPVMASAIDYTVTMEPTQARELIALELATAIDGVPTLHSRLSPTLELQTGAPVAVRLRFNVRSTLSYTAGPTTFDDSLTRWLQLPRSYNPRTLRFADELRAKTLSAAAARKSGGPAVPMDRQLVDAVLAHFRTESFRYNINAPLLGFDSIDEFLFSTRVGFCEHYASAFVFLMRAMDVPARVVTGYQGGEINPVDGYFTVRQSDAHAWAEVWLQDRGWVRVDPTAAIAPWRVEATLRQQRQDDVTSTLESWAWMRRFRLDREAIENAWNQWVLSYSAERQRTIISWLGLRPSMENIAAVALTIIGTLLVLLAFGSLRRRRHLEPLAEMVVQVRGKLDRAGIPVPPTMGLEDLRAYLETRLAPHCLPETRLLLSRLGAARYARPIRQGRAARLRSLRQQLRRWRPEAA